MVAASDDWPEPSRRFLKGMGVILYHFTAQRFINSIVKQGLTRGVMLKSLNPPSFIFGKQWLTKNPSFEQEWAVGSGLLPYERNEVRLTIEIPEALEENVKPWTQMKFMVPDVANDLSAFGDPENWMIYCGDIRPHWIAEILRKEATSHDRTTSKN